jgi:N-glycosylase/DNA lyase
VTGWEDAAQLLLEAPPSTLSLPRTLDCGQAFRWRVDAGGWWTGVVGGRAVRMRREEGETVRVQILPEVDDPARFVVSYLRLDVDLERLYAAFSGADPWITSAVADFPGLRLLRQEPQETLLSYICSTANSVGRISRSVEEMSRRYGRFVAAAGGRDFYAFPSAGALAAAPEAELATGCGLGWRGANLKRVAAEVAEMPDRWPEQLRELSYREAKRELMSLRGVGAKIADCVCLFSLDKDEAVPVDTHIWAVAREIFGVQILTRTLTPATYELIAGLFVERYGAFAGWAQEYLYLQRRASKRLFAE